MFLVLCLSAQQPQRQRASAEERAKNETELMKKELNPTAEQLAKLDSLNLVHAKKMDELLASAGGDREKIRDVMQTTMNEKLTAMQKILTDEQFVKWIKVFQEQQQQRQGQGQGRPGQGQGQGQGRPGPR